MSISVAVTVANGGQWLYLKIDPLPFPRITVTSIGWVPGLSPCSVMTNIFSLHSLNLMINQKNSSIERRASRLLLFLYWSGVIRLLWDCLFVLCFVRHAHFVRHVHSSRSVFFYNYSNIIACYRSGTVNSNTVNSKFHLIRSFFEIFARFLSFHV